MEVSPQYGGLTGQVQNCQVMPVLTYASAAGHTIVNRRLYLPRRVGRRSGPPHRRRSAPGCAVRDQAGSW
ncbi:transposase [Nonomuraea sp. FMUSA5-5]|uniref:Transposase n=1 Tax=Nonomuraea composti TaxID=2720023 RepID=A0ABX1BIB5_9ACTN|nr:transposase [Nonomuraea sp. FMUSA5-5]